MPRRAAAPDARGSPCRCRQPAVREAPDFFQTIVEFFTTGNLVAKVGVVILFFGVAFLLRFAAERGLLPIEFRLMGTAAAAVAMLGAGWWLRQSHADYAKAVQGGAVGILYLTIFAAYRLYALIDALPALALMLAVVVLSGALAVLQSSPALAALGPPAAFWRRSWRPPAAAATCRSSPTT